ncbi:unnamed protein product [Linum tenue]|uniref:Uncharacterized protein n=1 Tax=Linum tenue TaxID=586396 RepID=A0AAV0KQ87_9ROSI|nr:unnamed protein product [Linum tenue]
MLPARFVMAFDNASAEETPFPPPDISSPRSNFANFSFICSISATPPNIQDRSSLKLGCFLLVLLEAGLWLLLHSDPLNHRWFRSRRRCWRCWRDDALMMNGHGYGYP